MKADLDLANDYDVFRHRIAEADELERITMLRELATELRRTIVHTIDQAGMGHIGGDLSVSDILVTLFGAVLCVDPRSPNWPERDRLILSKGHCSVSLYAMLARCGFFEPSALKSFSGALSPLNGHPDCTKVPGVETNTGPLGHGLPVGVGSALAAHLKSASRRTFVVLGDGELQEGSNWEAAMTADRYELASLTAVVDHNRLQQGARVEDTTRLAPLGKKWRSFGWEVREVDGHDYGQLLRGLEPSTTGKPVSVIAHTVKGKGVSFMEDRLEWHHKVPDRTQVRKALEGLI